MFDLNLLRTFVAVAEKRRLSLAATMLGLPKSTVSRHVARLEEDARTKLFNRRPDGFDLTPSGQRLYDRSSRAVHELARDVFGLAMARRQGTVRVQSPAIYGRGVLKPIVTEYLMSRPDCAIDLSLADRFSAPDLEATDLGIFVGLAPGRNVDLWSAGFVEARLYAAPGLLDALGTPRSLSDLQSWPLLTPDGSAGEQGRIRFHDAAGSVALLGPLRLSTADPDVILDAALAGLGLARLPTFFAARHVARGDLVPVLPDQVVDRHAVTMARSRRNANPAATDFAEFVIDRLAAS